MICFLSPRRVPFARASPLVPSRLPWRQRAANTIFMVHVFRVTQPFVASASAIAASNVPRVRTEACVKNCAQLHSIRTVRFRYILFDFGPSSSSSKSKH